MSPTTELKIYFFLNQRRDFWIGNENSSATSPAAWRDWPRQISFVLCQHTRFNSFTRFSGPSAFIRPPERGHVRFHWSACVSQCVRGRPVFIDWAGRRLSGSNQRFQRPLSPTADFQFTGLSLNSSAGGCPGLRVIRIMSVISLSTRSFAYST